MLDTPSIFDALDQDERESRDISRRALALAHRRVESHVGRFLRAAQSEEEFMERLGLVVDDFTGYVVSASEEVGHDHPEHIAASLKDHYRLAASKSADIDTDEPGEDEESEPKPKDKKEAADKVEFADPDKEEEDGEDDGPPWAKKDSSTTPDAYSRWRTAKVTAPEGKQGLPLAEAAGRFPVHDPRQPVGTDGPRILEQDQGGMGTQWPAANSEFDPHGDFPASTEGPGIRMPDGSIVAPNITHNPDEYPFDQHLGPMHQGANNPAEQKGNGSDLVTCPQCGGNGKTANNSECRKCHGKGKVANFGDSMVDNVGADIKTAGETTGLGGPEPKIDKAHKAPEKYKEKSKRWPVKEKDPIEPIIAENRDQEGHDLKEIGEQTTERVELDSASPNDSGLYDGGETQGPHTRTFPKGKQADPVTRKSESSVIQSNINGEWPSETAVRQALAKLR
jgi:hypothetical protein